MVECEHTFLFFFKFFRCFRIMDHRPAGQNLIHTICRNSRSWKHNRQHAYHKESHNNLHRVLDKRHHIADLHLSVVDSFCTGPHDQNRDPVHNKHHDRHHKRHRAIYEQICFHQIHICFVKPLFLMLLCTKRPDHRKSGQYFSHNKVHFIN